MSTGENEQALRKIMDMTRWIAIFILILHYYYYCYPFFALKGWVWEMTHQILLHIKKAGLFTWFMKSKLISLTFLILSSLGIKGKKSENITYRSVLKYLIPGLLTYLFSGLFLTIGLSASAATFLYITLTSLGYILILTGSTLLSRIIKDALSDDIFNEENETFPQEEEIHINEYSINLPAQYQLKKKQRKSWISIVNPFRGILVSGTPGAGKTYFVIRHIITQHIAKGFSMFVYDFKFPDLSVIAYNHFLKNKSRYKANASCYFINFDDLTRTHRCNALDPDGMLDITDAAEAARTILLGLNKSWIQKSGDFFVESPINFLTAIIWFLKKYQGGEFCTLPHVLEFMQLDYEKLFTILRLEQEVEVLINPFVQAFLNGAVEQLEGQIASAKVALARLSSPQLYYVLSGNDFTLDINNPDAPKLICMGNNPQKIQIYGAVLSLYVNRLVKLVNQKNKLKSSLVFDEFPTVYLSGIDSLIATARSNKVSTTLGLQDLAQLRKDYGKDLADVILGIVGNIISGQLTGEMAKQLSERIGKIMQDRQSLSINRTDTSISKSKQLEAAVPASKIAGLSSGEFVGMVADSPDQKINLKAFHCGIMNDHKALAEEERNYLPIPVIRQIDNEIVLKNYNLIKEEVQEIVLAEISRMQNDPELEHLIVGKR